MLTAKSARFLNEFRVGFYKNRAKNNIQGFKASAAGVPCEYRARSAKLRLTAKSTRLACSASFLCYTFYILKVSPGVMR